MNREYDIFEQLPDGDVEWRGLVVGLEAARARLGLLAKRSRTSFSRCTRRLTKSSRGRTPAEESQQELRASQ